MHGRTPPTRREIIRTAALGAGALAVGPLIRPALAGDANDRIGIALIGQGEMGTNHRRMLKGWRDDGRLNIDLVHICDVYRRRLDIAAADVGTQNKAMDYRRVIDDRNVHVVLIATPDHWHHKIAKEAMEAGKDVYVEKPMCHTIEQARDLVETQARTSRVVQVGTQSASDDVYEKIAAEIAKGSIGPLVMVTGSCARNGTAGEWRNFGLKLPGSVEAVDMEARPGPDLDWDMFLGHKWGLAPKRDWQPARFFQFRCYWDYSGGIATDLYFHQVAHLLKATGLGFPQRVTATGGIYVFNEKHTTPQGWPDDRDVPDTYATTIDYPGGPTFVLAGSMCNDRNLSEEIRGHLATVHMTDTGAEIRPQAVHAKKDVIKLQRTRNGDHGVHWPNFLEAVRNRTPEKCNAPIQLGYRTNVAISMGVMAYRTDKVMRWDAEKQEACPA
ncbi:MAG: hypothetical protein AMXMBFR13_45980 [Phycisphaerae bacterium]